MKKNQNKFALLSALAAGIGYGAWAIFANYEHGTNAWAMAGTVQALYAFASTLLITHVAQWAFLKCKGGRTGIAAGLTVSFIIMLATPLAIHKIAGTPNIWQTILPGLIWGSIYLMSYLIALNIKHKKSQ